MARKNPPSPDNPLRGGPYVDALFGVHANTRRRRIKAGAMPPPDLTIQGRHYWFEETLRRAAAGGAP